MVRPAGFEPAAFGSGDQRSIQLSYGRIVDSKGLTDYSVWGNRPTVPKTMPEIESTRFAVSPRDLVTDNANLDFSV